MKRPLIVALALALLAVVAACLLRRPPAPPPAPASARGAQLANTHCAGCHLFPAPDLLPQAAWVDHVQPDMAVWLGLKRFDYETEPDGKILREANLFPTAPAISKEDWLAIWKYYTDTAPPHPLPQDPKPVSPSPLKNFRVRKVNHHPGAPMTSLLKIDPAGRRLFIGDAFAGLLVTVNPAGELLATLRLPSAPVSLSLQPAGQYVTLIGHIFPSDKREGGLIFLPRDQTIPQVRPVLEQLPRPTDTTVADLDGDGRNDFAVCAYGNRLGRFSWFQNLGEGRYREHVLLDRPGATRVEARDFNGDGRPDLIVLMAQAREGIYLFLNQGRGEFKMQTIVEQPPTFGYAGLEVTDFNGDGHLDLLTANGDNGDFPSAPRNYHGIRLLLNDGRNNFTQAWFHPLHGAYKALARDFDADGDLDIAAIAFYPDFENAPEESFVLLENLGQHRFIPRTIPESTAGRWLTLDAGDLDGDGDIDLALGSFVAGPTTVPVPATARENWRANGAAALILENLRR